MYSRRKVQKQLRERWRGERKWHSQESLKKLVRVKEEYNGKPLQYCYNFVSFQVSPFSSKNTCFMNCSEVSADGLRLLRQYRVLSGLGIEGVITEEKPDQSIRECTSHDFLHAFHFLSELAPNAFWIGSKGTDDYENFTRPQWLLMKTTIQCWVAKTLWKYRKIIKNGRVRHPGACSSLTLKISRTIPRLFKRLLQINPDFGYVVSAIIDCDWRSGPENDFYKNLRIHGSLKYYKLLTVLLDSTEPREMGWTDTELVEMCEELSIILQHHY